MTIGSNGWHKLSGSPVPKRDVENASRPCSDVVTYRLSDEELERYRNMGKPKRPSGPLATRERTEPRVDEGEKNMEFRLSRDQYLTERMTKSRADIAKEQGITAPGLLYHLGKWGLKDSAVEAQELDKLRNARVDEKSDNHSVQVHDKPDVDPIIDPPVDEKPPVPSESVQLGLKREVTFTVALDEKFIIAAFEAVTDEVHQIAVEHGWHDSPVPLPVQLALIHSEVSECLEADRKHEGDERVAEELADVVIRAMDTAAAHKLDLAGALFAKMGNNRNREFRHGNRKY